MHAHFLCRKAFQILLFVIVVSPAHAQQAFTRHKGLMARYDLTHARLDVSLENTSRDVAGSVRYQALALQAVDTLALQLYSSFTIDSVVVNGRRSTGIRFRNHELRAALPQALPAGQRFTTQVFYHGTAPSGGGASNALATGSDPQYNVPTTYSFSQPFGAYEWWPCKQVLTDKLDSADIWITTTLPNKAGSNGRLVRAVPLAGNKVRYEWKTRHPIAYYLVSVAVAPYVEHTQTADVGGGVQVPIVNYVYNQQALNDALPVLQSVPVLMEGFSQLVGPYPFADEKYGHCMAPMGPGQGMEHQTMTSLAAFGDPLLVAHELFHQWFGDVVTCASYQDIWLNEGFADYGAYLAVAAQDAETARGLLDSVNRFVLSEPGGSVRVPDADTLNDARIFNTRLSYRKGALLVHMLRYMTQDDALFFGTLQSYLATHRGRTVRTADLRQAFEQALRQPLTAFFDQWYRGEGYPTFNVAWNQVGGQVYLRVTEAVSAPTVTPFFNTDVDYRLISATDTVTVRLRQAAPISEFTVPFASPLTAIEVDPDAWILNGNGTLVRDPNLVLATRPRQALPLRLFPNPADEAITVENPVKAPVRADILNTAGRCVHSQILTAAPHHRLPLTGLPAGIYRICLHMPDGSERQARFVHQQTQ